MSLDAEIVDFVYIVAGCEGTIVLRKPEPSFILSENVTVTSQILSIWYIADAFTKNQPPGPQCITVDTEINNRHLAGFSLNPFQIASNSLLLPPFR